MGTCIGKRNIRYFLGFLFMTSMHAFITFGICATYFLQVTSKIDQFDRDKQIERLWGMLSAGVGIYSAVIALTLLGFSIYSISLAAANITSNENLRTRWHAKRK